MAYGHDASSQNCSLGRPSLFQKQAWLAKAGLCTKGIAPKLSIGAQKCGGVRESHTTQCSLIQRASNPRQEALAVVIQDTHR